MRVQNRILVLRVMAAGLLIAGALFTASPAAADDARTCTYLSKDVDVPIAACTRAIASGQYAGQDLAALHISRALAYWAKGQLDRTREDFEQAIRLDPPFAPGDRDDPVDVGDGLFFVCCRALVYDGRVKAVWRLRDTQGADEQCVQTCARKIISR